MVRWGNKRANEYWEARVPDDYYIPDENDGVGAVERWIRDKYEKRKFAAKSLPACAAEAVDLSLPMAQLMNWGGGGRSGGGGGGGGEDGKVKKEKKASSDKAAAPALAKAASSKSIAAPAPAPAPAGGDDLLDLLGFDFAGPKAAAPAPAPAAGSAPAAASGGVDPLMAAFAPAPPAAVAAHSSGGAGGGLNGLEASFAAFGTGVAAPPPPPTAASKAADIMALYGPAQPAGGLGGVPVGMGGFAPAAAPADPFSGAFR